MNESDTLIYDLLYSVLEQIPSAAKTIRPQMTKGEMSEILRLNSSKIYEAFQDLSITFESLNFIASDYQLRMKAEDIWKQQLEVFRNRIKPAANDLKLTCEAENVVIDTFIEKIINY